LALYGLLKKENLVDGRFGALEFTFVKQLPSILIEKLESSEY